MDTKEAVKPERTAVKCTSCGKQHQINELVKEEPLPYPHNSVVEGFLLCPDCGFRTHSYYMPEQLRQEQERLNKALALYQADKSPKAFRQYDQHLKVYQNNFTTAQAKYRALMETESGRSSTS